MADERQLGAVFAPQSKDEVFPADHLWQNQTHWNHRQTNEKEQRISPLHYTQAFLVTKHLHNQYQPQPLLFVGEINNDKLVLSERRQWQQKFGLWQNENYDGRTIKWLKLQQNFKHLRLNFHQHDEYVTEQSTSDDEWCCQQQFTILDSWC